MRVLIVEDDPIIGMAAERALLSAGHEVIGPFLRVADALAGAETARADMALVDINLFGKDEGPDLARMLTARFGLPCLFASGQPETARANKDAAVGLLHKPYSDQELQAAMPVLQEKLAGGHPPPPALPRGLEMF